MSCFKPSEFRITDEAIKKWKLKKGSSVLDIGCGQGETVEYLGKEYGFKATGIDFSKEMIARGLARSPKLKIQFGDGEFLEDFSSYSFDGVMMECSLSLIYLPDEALHEAYCVLKKGGKLFISDLYIKNPTSEFLKETAEEAEIKSKQPGSCGGDHGHDHAHNAVKSNNSCSDCTECGDCTSHEHECTHDEDDDHGVHDYEGREPKSVAFRKSGRFLIEPLVACLEEIGYQNIEWQDCSVELDNFVAAKLMQDGTLEGCFCKEGLKPADDFKTGYFMLTAEKPL